MQRVRGGRELEESAAGIGRGWEGAGDGRELTVAVAVAESPLAGAAEPLVLGERREREVAQLREGGAGSSRGSDDAMTMHTGIPGVGG